MAIKDENRGKVKGIVQSLKTINGAINSLATFRGEVASPKKSPYVAVLSRTVIGWNSEPHLMSVKNVLYIYTDYRQIEDPDTHEIINIPAVKIGDGENYLINLPFTTIAITPEDVERWDTGYAPILMSDLLTSIQVGGVASGVTYEEGTLLEVIFRDMLCPLLFPTLTNPSLTLNPSGSLLLEKGSTRMETITAVFSRGSIDPAYGTSGYRSGEVESYKINNGNVQVSNVFEVVLDQYHNTFTGTANYAEGEQPKDSQGGDYDSPLPAGSVNSPVLTYEFVNAIWANITNQQTISKCQLVSASAKQKIFEFPACSISNPETFDIPTSWNITAIEVKNDLNGLYEDCAVEFSLSDTTHSDAGGTTVAYTRYTCNLGYDMGARTIRVKWS